MLIRKKVNLLKYFACSIIHIGSTFFIVKNLEEYNVVLLVFLATVLNQWMLIESIESMINVASGKSQEDSLNTVLIFLGKSFLLLAALTFGVHIMGKRIIIPLLNYIVQIFILYISFRQKDS